METKFDFPYGFPTAFTRYLAGTDQKWPHCTNAEPGSYGHECGEPARYIAYTPSNFAVCFCAACKLTGSEGLNAKGWIALPAVPLTEAGTPALSFEASRRA
jgi:hypothetical protein